MERNRKPESLLNQSARVVVRQIRFRRNLLKLQGEIPLTLIRHLRNHYIRFSINYFDKLDTFMHDHPHTMITNLRLFRDYNFKLNGVNCEESMGNGMYASHFYCHFCFNNYVKFKVPSASCISISTLNNYKLTLQGIDFIDHYSEHACSNCRLLVIKLDDEDEDIFTSSCPNLPTQLLYTDELYSRSCPNLCGITE